MARELRDKLRVYFVVGSQDCGNDVERTLAIAREALAGGVGILQFRDKKSRLDEAGREALARQLRTLCREAGALFFVNDDVPLAIRLKADGVHVGQEDMPLARVRRLVPPGMLVGVSAGTVEEALSAKAGGADYLGVGAMYDTASKADAGEPIGPEGLRRIREAVGTEMPIVGIGGIGADNARAVIEAGADGVAVISAITRAPSPRDAAAQLGRVVADAIAGR